MFCHLWWYTYHCSIFIYDKEKRIEKLTSSTGEFDNVGVGAGPPSFFDSGAVAGAFDGGEFSGA